MTAYAHLFRPSLYTAALLQVLETECGNKKQSLDCVLDVGVGAGVLLAALGALGASELWGVDINPDALQASSELLDVCSEQVPRHLLLGDLWDPLPAKKKFDVIAANLPHFPGAAQASDRGLAWGGGDGRALMSRFLLGLPERLQRNGAAYLTHHDLVGLEETSEILSSVGLCYATLSHTTVFEPPERMRAVSAHVIAQNGASLRMYGGYAFVDARVLKVTFDS
jgi:release factor glutamine methyltransferase